MQSLQFRTEPQSRYLLAAAATHEGGPVDPSKLVELFPYVTSMSPIGPESQYCGSSQMQQRLTDVLQRHKEASLKHWQQQRTSHLESLRVTTVEPCTTALHALEEEYRQVRLSGDRSEKREHLRAELVAADVREAEAENNYLLEATIPCESEVTTLFELQWAIVGREIDFSVDAPQTRTKKKRKDIYLPCPFCGGDLENFSKQEVACRGKCGRIIELDSLSLTCCKCGDERSRHFVVVRFRREGTDLGADGKGGRYSYSFCDQCLENLHQSNGKSMGLPNVTIEKQYAIPTSVTRIGRP